MALAPAVCCPCCRQRTRTPFPVGVKEPVQFGSPPGGLGQGDRSIASKSGVWSGTDTSLQREIPDSACGEPLMDGRMPLGLVEPLPPGSAGRSDQTAQPDGHSRVVGTVDDSGADSFVAIAFFGRFHEEWLCTFPGCRTESPRMTRRGESARGRMRLGSRRTFGTGCRMLYADRRSDRAHQRPECAGLPRRCGRGRERPRAD